MSGGEVVYANSYAVDAGSPSVYEADAPASESSSPPVLAP
jgi:hypothetical protein